MCASPSECSGGSACIAGRCVAQGATAAIDNGRRLLFEPVDAAYLRRRGDHGDVPIATLGRAGDGGAVALLRFSARVPPEANVLEAYLLLERAVNVDVDPAASIALHAERVVEPWDSASVSWASSPRIEDVGAPVTRVSPTTGPLIRLEVRELVQSWRRHGHRDFGVAIVAEGTTVTGVSFAWQPVPTAAGRRDPLLEPPAAGLEPPSPFEPGPPASALARQVGQPRAELVGPRLEVYVR
jgi:hypothetical protein